jgi:hypothetical protein
MGEKNQPKLKKWLNFTKIGGFPVWQRFKPCEEISHGDSSTEAHSNCSNSDFRNTSGNFTNLFLNVAGCQETDTPDMCQKRHFREIKSWQTFREFFFEKISHLTVTFPLRGK